MEQTFVDRLKWAGLIWLARRLPDCKTLTPKLGESLDKELSRYERIVNYLHLLTCEACRLYLSQIKFISDAMHHCESGPDGGNQRPLTELTPAAKEKLKRAVGREHEPNM